MRFIKQIVKFSFESKSEWGDPRESKTTLET